MSKAKDEKEPGGALEIDHSELVATKVWSIAPTILSAMRAAPVCIPATSSGAPFGMTQRPSGRKRASMPARSPASMDSNRPLSIRLFSATAIRFPSPFARIELH